jgi:hypothetical protein
MLSIRLYYYVSSYSCKRTRVYTESMTQITDFHQYDLIRVTT